MRLALTHTGCGREATVRQVLESQGHCPWDGRPLSAHYTAVLAEALEEAEVAGAALLKALDKVASARADLTIDPESVLGPIRQVLARVAGQGVAR